jgi:hypothetical protein
MLHRNVQKRSPVGGNRSGLKRKLLTKQVKQPTAKVLHKDGKRARGELSTVFGNGFHPAVALPQNVPKTEQLKAKEELLRLEIRENRTLLLVLFRWGVAVLAGLESSLYFIRRDAASHLAQIGALPANGTVPLGRWLAGTAFVAMIAAIFCVLADYTIKRHLKYRSQLLKMRPSYSGIRENGLSSNKMNKIHYVLFFAFPVFDFVLWFYFSVAGFIKIPW